ncbi:hypothetical protein FisN_5Lh472 [Fistulifera solaris]|uniref:Uncharacterized protein n=1 Tax=Fistulifera solaris TaxID=1519565 RepID=A0A1Z5KGZ5_FISSO|nr:hypothetical protein FisN_5Lh472 [Fistulifera solaris]|eukprot:GAX25375.1 hypothetical protein FisN_5Lh472 [Fistulifera solaris]
MRFFTRRRDLVSSGEPHRSTIDRYGDNEDEQSQANVSTINKQGKQDGRVSKKRDKDKKKKKKNKSKRDKEKRKSASSSSKLVDRVPTVASSCESLKTQDIDGEKFQDDAHDLIASDDDGDDRYSVAGHLSRGGRSSAGVSVLSDDSDEYGARWRSWDDDEDVEFRDNSPATDDEMATTDDERKKVNRKKKKKKHRSKSKDISSKKKKKGKSNKPKQSEEGVRDQPEVHDSNPAIKDSKKLMSTACDSLIQVLGATVSDGQDHALIEEVEIEHIFTTPVEKEGTESTVKNPVESDEEEVVDMIDKKEGISYNKLTIPDNTFDIDNDDGVVHAFTTNKKELLELDEYSVHDLENHSALGQCLRFYSCNGIARLLEFQPKLLPPVVKKDTMELPTVSANQNFELLLGVKSPVASDPLENIIVRGDSEDSFDVLHEAPSLDAIKKNPSVVVDLTGKNLCLDDESSEDQPSRKSRQGHRHRKRTPRTTHKVTVTSIEIPESKLKKGKQSAKASSITESDKSDKTLQVRNKKAPKRGLWLKRRHLDSDDKSVSSVRSAASSRASTSTDKKRSVQSFFLRMQGKRAQC